MATNKKGVIHVYKLDTKNHQPDHHHHPSTPPPTATTTTEKPIIWSLGALLRRSKTYRENNNHNYNYNFKKEDAKQIVQETSRISLPAIKDGRKSGIEKGRKAVSGIGEWRKGVKGVEVGAVAGRRSAENRAEVVMINVGEVADLFHVKVLETDMPAFMQVHAFRCGRQVFDSLDESSPKQMAFHMKKDFDKVYGPTWHCIVGSSFGSFVTHATGCFIYFTMKKLYILVFKTKVQKT